MQDTPHQMKDYLRSYCFSKLDLCRKRNLKNVALMWVTLEKNNFNNKLSNEYKMSTSQLCFVACISSLFL